MIAMNKQDTETNTKRDVALVLSSGGARGLAHIGAIEELLNEGYHITSIAGCSMGALIGGVYAAGKLEDFREWMKTIDRKKMLELTDFSFSLNHLVKGSRIIEAIMERSCPYPTAPWLPTGYRVRKWCFAKAVCSKPSAHPSRYLPFTSLCAATA